MTNYQKGYMDGYKKGWNLALGYVRNPKSYEDEDNNSWIDKQAIAINDLFLEQLRQSKEAE